MALRENMKARKKQLFVAAGVVGLLAIGAIAMQVTSQSGVAGSPQGSFYSVDDGATYFADNEVRIPPFDYHGKMAVRAHVGRQTDGVVKVFYLERLKPDAHAAVVKLRTQQPTTPADMEALAKGVEFKTPGGSNWQTFKDPAARSGWVQSLVGSDKKVPEYLSE